MNAAFTCDAVVVGAGIVGAMIADRLSRTRPRQRIALLDQSLVANGATRFSAGLHMPYGRTARIRRLTRESETGYRQLARRDTSLPISPVRFVGIAAKQHVESESVHFTNAIRVTQPRHIAASSLPRMHRTGALAAIVVDGGHYANAAGVAERLIAPLRAATNVRVWEGVRVASFDAHNEFVDIELHDGRSLRAARAVLAPGPWVCMPPFQHAAKSFGIRIKKVVSLHIDLAPRASDPAIYFLDDEAFLLPVRQRGHWLFSYACQHWDVVPDPDTLAVEKSDRQTALKILRRYFPELPDRCLSGRAFCDAYSPNREPVVARLPAMANVVFAGAANGSGYRLAPAIAAEAAMLLGR
jgi:glycine/D-amino acid oxidase-like deaminating enzyme